LRKLILLESALEDLTDIVRYISNESGSRKVARQFAERLRGQCRKLAKLPGSLGTARPDLLPGLRSFAFKNYIIFFRYSGSAFEVVNILEGHRDITGFYNRDG
jgi:plasmid stabilization system protein ParE